MPFLSSRWWDAVSLPAKRHNDVGQLLTRPVWNPELVADDRVPSA